MHNNPKTTLRVLQIVGIFVVFVLAAILSLPAKAAQPKEITLVCDGYEITMTHKGNGPISAEISFEPGRWVEVFDNPSRGNNSLVTLASIDTPKVAVVGITPSSGQLYLQIFKDSFSHAAGAADHSLRCRKQVDDGQLKLQEKKAQAEQNRKLVIARQMEERRRE